MLINLWLTPIHNELKFDLPPIVFKQGQGVCISHLFIQFSKQTKSPAVILQSTLIDKSSLNPTQQLLFAYSPGFQKRFDFTPTHKEYYKIQCLDFQSSEFKLVDSDNNKLINIEKIYIQLDIDERIQPITFKA